MSTSPASESAALRRKPSQPPEDPKIILAEYLGTCRDMVAECFDKGTGQVPTEHRLAYAAAAARLMQVSIALVEALEEKRPEFIQRVVVERIERHGQDNRPEPQLSSYPEPLASPRPDTRPSHEPARVSNATRPRSAAASAKNPAPADSSLTPPRPPAKTVTDVSERVSRRSPVYTGEGGADSVKTIHGMPQRQTHALAQDVVQNPAPSRGSVQPLQPARNPNLQSAQRPNSPPAHSPGQSPTQRPNSPPIQGPGQSQSQSLSTPAPKTQTPHATELVRRFD